MEIESINNIRVDSNQSRLDKWLKSQSPESNINTSEQVQKDSQAHPTDKSIFSQKISSHPSIASKGSSSQELLQSSDKELQTVAPFLAQIIENNENHSSNKK